MAGQSWFVGLEWTFTNKVLWVLFKYGWGDFCANNNLNVGDTYFFSVICMATCSNDEEEEQEEELEDNEVKLKVEVRKTNGGWRQWTQRKSWHDLYFVVSLELLSDLSRFPSIELS